MTASAAAVESAWVGEWDLYNEHALAMGSVKEQVLIVDDEVDFRLLVRDLLEAEGYEVADAGDVQAALALLEDADTVPSVLIVDLRLPGESGWDLIEVVRDDDRLRRIPIIVVSGQPDLDLPPDLHLLVKPVAWEVLSSAIRELCRR